MSRDVALQQKMEVAAWMSDRLPNEKEKYYPKLHSNETLFSGTRTPEEQKKNRERTFAHL